MIDMVVEKTSTGGAIIYSRDLERVADDAELAFMQAARSIKSVEDEARVKELCHEYLKALKLMRYKRSVIATRIGNPRGLTVGLYTDNHSTPGRLLFVQPVSEVRLTHVKMGG